MPAKPFDKSWRYAAKLDPAAVLARTTRAAAATTRADFRAAARI